MTDDPVTGDRLRAWLAAYAQAFEDGDPAAAAALFADDPVYYETPFSDPYAGKDAARSYLTSFLSARAGYEVDVEVLATADELGLARWQATGTATDDRTRFETDVVLLLSLTDDDRCDLFREWRHRREL